MTQDIFNYINYILIRTKCENIFFFNKSLIKLSMKYINFEDISILT